MWTIATYQPTTFFSLRPALSTSSGGQTLVVPTPFALKMALLDVAIRGWGLEQTVAWFPILRDLQVAIAPPDRLIINHTFIKIQRLKKNIPKELDDRELFTPLNATIAFRAFVQFGGNMQIAVTPGAGLATESKSKKSQVVATTPPPLAALLAQLSYLGKRGGFFQLQTQPTEVETLPEYPDGRFVRLTNSLSFRLDGLMQVLDDCAPHLEFAQVNVYDPKSLQVGKDRLLKHVALPYRLKRSSQRYQLYEFIQP